MAGAYAGMVYWPTPLEFGVTLGVVALGVPGASSLGLKFLPLAPESRGGLAFRVAASSMCRPAPPLPGRGPLRQHARRFRS